MSSFDIMKTTESLSQKGLDQEIYEAINEEDLSDVCVATLDALHKAKLIPPYKEHVKSEATSVYHRNNGNKAYGNEEYKTALECYNKALLYAPKNSEALTLAYSNRSALFFRLKVYSACIKDISVCLSMSCPNKIVNKLHNRRRESLQHITSEKQLNLIYESAFGNIFFDFKVKYSQIPYASADIEISRKSDSQQVIAANDIKVGTLVALEAPFISTVHSENLYFSCYYCHNKPLHLIPCDGCCFALFCSESCKTKCMDEYHGIECQIMDMLHELCSDSLLLMVKATLKMRQKCESWEEFVTASLNIGLDKMKTSSVKEIYSADSKFSLLCHTRENYFVHGRIFNTGMFCAVIIHYLEKVPKYLPQSVKERDAAIRALTRIMMHLYLKIPTVNILNSAQNVINHELATDTTPDLGWFSLTSKLKHECDANLLVLGVNNKVALIALHPIKRGDELKISYIGHWYEYIYINGKDNFRSKALFIATETICNCKVCKGEWSSNNLRKGILSKAQRKCYQSINSYTNDKRRYIETSDALSLFHGKENTVEHHNLFKQFRTTLSLFQYLATKNKILLENLD